MTTTFFLRLARSAAFTRPVLAGPVFAGPVFAATVLACTVLICTTLASTAPARAQAKPFGKGFDGWAFTATLEGNGVTNCRATRRVGGRDDILALKTDRKDYVSVRAEDRKGRWPGSFIVPFREPKNGQQYDGTAAADGTRLWMAVDRNFIETIAQRGGFELYLGGTEDNDKVPLGNQALKAFVRLKECIVANGG